MGRTAPGASFPGWNGYAAGMGFMRESLQSNNYINAGPIIWGGTQPYESISITQVLSRIIDNNGKGNKKRVDFF
jgi:hypothetical protein